MLFKTNYSLISTKLCRFVDSVEVGEVKQLFIRFFSSRIESDEKIERWLIRANRRGKVVPSWLVATKCKLRNSTSELLNKRPITSSNLVQVETVELVTELKNW